MISRAARDPFLLLCGAHGVPLPVCELEFHRERKWRFDYAWPLERLALEQEGGVNLERPGRHTRPIGFADDCRKYAEAVLAGWRVLRATPLQMRNGTAIGWVERALGLETSEARLLARIVR